ncbi:hypothetical protein M8C21_011111 [Ambrosia artemisiifolia]|uniref:mitogen-activated protein kinase kinase kinase n=1 Tax=Ambrosia artemisiifolia TaxID=4212 RepID=A0AAD5GE18_AMBAR|nr:hypothetical protein M8C21_011111 [Ambrosia artemisiifolia]
MKSKFIEKNMPAWFGRKSTKDKDNPHKNHFHNNNINNHQDNPFYSSNYNPSDRKNKTSFDDGLLSGPTGSPRVSRDFSGPSSGQAVGGGHSGSGFNGFELDRVGHRLPQPGRVLDQGNGSGSISGSGLSSGGSSVSSGDEQSGGDHGQLGVFKGHGDTKLSPQPRSPGPGSKVGTAATSPFHQRLACTSLDSPNRKLDDGKNAGHPLPLPPGSPTSSSSALNCCSPTSPSSVLSNMKTLSVTDNSSCQPSKWKKGRLLGRGTFGHVYLGFNSENGQMCAIKEVKVVADDPSSKECLKQLNQEIALLSQLSHPNIVQYYGSELRYKRGKHISGP